MNFIYFVFTCVEFMSSAATRAYMPANGLTVVYTIIFNKESLALIIIIVLFIESHFK